MVGKLDLWQQLKFITFGSPDFFEAISDQMGNKLEARWLAV